MKAYLIPIGVIAGVAVTTVVYAKLSNWQLSRKDPKEWGLSEKNIFRVMFELLLLLFIGVPAIMVIICSAPLVLAFDEMSPVAWGGIFISNLVSLFISLFIQKQAGSLFVAAKKKDDEEQEVVDERKKKTVLRVVNSLYGLCGFVSGVLAGYYGIIHQSIWMSFGVYVLIHALSFVTLSFVLVFVFVLISLSSSNSKNK